MHKILVNVMREEIRMAVIDENEQLIDFVLERTDEFHMANHIYKGTVKNVLNGMQAAFVDITRVGSSLCERRLWIYYPHCGC